MKQEERNEQLEAEKTWRDTIEDYKKDILWLGEQSSRASNRIIDLEGKCDNNRLEIGQLCFETLIEDRQKLILIKLLIQKMLIIINQDIIEIDELKIFMGTMSTILNLEGIKDEENK